MTTTVAALSADIQRLKFLASADAAGGAAIISNADLVTNTNGWGPHLNSPALPIVSKAYGSQALARTAISQGSRFSLRAIPRTGNKDWLVDIDIDINGKPVINVAASTTNAAGTAIIELVFIYSKVK